MHHSIPHGGHAPARAPVPPPSTHTGGDRYLHDLVGAARAGDERAWSELIRRFDGQLRRIARTYRLNPADVDDALQATWIRLFKSFDQLDRPEAVGGWLATTTRRECLRLLQRSVRESATDDPMLGDGIHVEDPLAGLLAAEERRALRHALGALPERHRRLMELLTVERCPDYRAISHELGMPTGSIGPIRRRCLDRLAGDGRLAGLRPAGD